MRIVTVLTMLLSLQSCSQEPKIVITKDYISNKYWDEYNRILLIEKMKVKKDSVLDIFAPGFEKDVPNHWNITNKLEVDSTFTYRNSLSNEKKSNSSNTIYFNRRNTNNWNFGHFSIEEQVPIIGPLENSTWYKFSNLKTIPYYIYVYVDDTGTVHRFNVDMSNY